MKFFKRFIAVTLAVMMVCGVFLNNISLKMFAAGENNTIQFYGVKNPDFVKKNGYVFDDDNIYLLKDAELNGAANSVVYSAFITLSYEEIL